MNADHNGNGHIGPDVRAALADHTAARLLRDVPADEYHTRKLGRVSTGALKAALRTPAHYRAWVDAKDADDTEARDFGRQLHMAALEPFRFAQTYMVLPDGLADGRTREGKAQRAEWKAQAAGRQPIKAEDYRAIGGMIGSLARHPIVSRLIAHPDGIAESTLRWTDPLYGLECQARPDWLIPSFGSILDIKSALVASPGRWAYAARDFGYDLQAAHYLDGAFHCGGLAMEFVFAVVEKEPPYAVAVYELDSESLAKAREARLAAMRAIADGLATGVWPAYGDGIETLTIPRRKA